MAFNYWQSLESEKIYHMYNRSVNKERLFKVEWDYKYFLEKVEKYLFPYMDFYCYCLIPNHFHFLVEIRKLDGDVINHLKKEKTKAAQRLLNQDISFNSFLEDQFRRLFSCYALHFNHIYERNGALFQKRLKRVAIKNEVKLLNIICYIHHNPIHHNLVKDYQDWKYSSFSSFSKEQQAKINNQKVFGWFGSGDLKLGKELFFSYHKDFKQPPFKAFEIDD